MAQTLKFERRYAESEKLYTETLDARRRVLGVEHPAVTSSAFDFSEVLALDGKSDETLSQLKFAVEHALS